MRQSSSVLCHRICVMSHTLKFALQMEATIQDAAGGIWIRDAR